MRDNQYRIIFQEVGSLWQGIEWAKTLIGAKRISKKMRSHNEIITIYKAYSTDPLAQLMNNTTKWKNI